MSDTSRHLRLHVQISRFVVLGVVNSLATYSLFVLLALLIWPEVAYSIAFVAGLAVVIRLSPTFVFGSYDHGRRHRSTFLAWYLFVWSIGLTVTHARPGEGLRHHLITAVLVFAVTAPLNFLGGRMIFRPPTYARSGSDS